MSKDKHIAGKPLIPKNRLETLADGIFAISMTLLVLSITVPSQSGVITPNIIIDYVLTTLIPQIFIYIISFTLLAVFWMIHHIFYLIKSTNITILWINIFWLMSIAIVPFSTSMIGKYGQFQLSHLIFDVNMLIIGILSYINWYYATKHGMIEEKVIPYSDKIKTTFLALPILSILAILISFITPMLSILSFIIIPAIFTLYSVSKKHKNHNS